MLPNQSSSSFEKISWPARHSENQECHATANPLNSISKCHEKDLRTEEQRALAVGQSFELAQALRRDFGRYEYKPSALEKFLPKDSVFYPACPAGDRIALAGGALLAGALLLATYGGLPTLGTIGALAGGWVAAVGIGVRALGVCCRLLEKFL